MQPLQLLLLSHTLSSFSDRLWDFAFPLLLAALVEPKHALVLAAMYTMSGQCATFLFSSLLGATLDAPHHGLTFLTAALLLQNLSTVALSAALVLLSAGNVWVLSVPVALLSAVSSLASAAEKISITQEWAPALLRKALPKDVQRVTFNASLRQAYLGTKIVAPLVAGVALGASRSTHGALLFVCGWNVCSCVVELALLRRIHSMVPELRVFKEPASVSTTRSVVGDDGSGGGGGGSLYAALTTYANHPMALCSLAYCLLYCTVLCPGALLHIHLVTHYGVHEGVLAAFQAICSVLGMAGTFLVLALTRRMSLPAAAHAFLLAQVAVLYVGCVCLWWFGWSTMFLGLVALSRVGLWGFDVAHMSLMQDGLRDSAQRGSISAFQYGLCDVFSVAIAVPALVWSESADFPILMALSLLCVTAALLCFRAWHHGRLTAAPSRM